MTVGWLDLVQVSEIQTGVAHFLNRRIEWLIPHRGDLYSNVLLRLLVRLDWREPETLRALTRTLRPEQHRIEEEDLANALLWHKVVAISFVEATVECDGERGERYHVRSCRSGGEADWDERRLLESFWRYFGKEPTRVSSALSPQQRRAHRTAAVTSKMTVCGLRG